MLAVLALTLAVLGASPAALEREYQRTRALELQITHGARPRVVHDWAREMARSLVHARSLIGASESDPTLIRAMEESTEAVLSKLAVNLHNFAKRRRADDLFRLTADLYDAYLALFPSQPKAYDLRFFHAELLYDNLNDYRMAAREYTAGLEQDLRRRAAGQAPGRWMRNAAYNAVLAYKEILTADKTRPAKTAKHKPQRLPQHAQDLVMACLRYADVVEDEKTPDVLYSAATVYYGYDHLDEARRLFEKIAFAPDTGFSEVAANLALDSLNLQRDWPGLLRLARRFAEKPAFSERFKQDLAKTIEQAQRETRTHPQKSAPLPQPQHT